MLVRSAFSANIKERRDCSTALFDERGRMIVQAEHIPVHLGAMPEAVAAVLARDPQPGEIYVINDPYTGGTHLPDITLVSRVPCGFACSRAHHADVGGMEPGEPPGGLARIVPGRPRAAGAARRRGARRVLLANMRNPDERRGDLRAQLAAHRLAERRLARARRAAGRGHGRRPRWMSSTRYSERVVRAAIAACRTAATRRTTSLEPVEGELEIRARRDDRGRRDRDRLRGDVAAARGQSQLPTRRHALGLLLRRPLPRPSRTPSSGGAYAPVSVTAPAGSLVNARPPAAVVAGNTETSSRIVDVVFAAFGQAVPVPAQGQGTMNNVTFGNRAVHVLRDARRRPGRMPRRRRAERRARGDVEHAEHAGRGARALVSVARRALRAASRLGRRGRAPWRRRRRPRAARARGLPPVAADRAAAPRAARRGGRRATARWAGSS